MRTSERSTFHKGSRHSAVTVCLLLVMCLVFLTACGKDKKDNTVANVNTEETLTNTEVPTTESVIDTEEVVDTENRNRDGNRACSGSIESGYGSLCRRDCLYDNKSQCEGRTFYRCRGL